MNRKKVATFLAAAVLTVGIGSQVFANEDNDANTKEEVTISTIIEKRVNGEVPELSEVQPIIEEVHPDWSAEEIEEMYEFCENQDGRRPGMMRGGFGPRFNNNL